MASMHAPSTRAPLPLIVALPPLPPDERRAERERDLAILHAEMRACEQCVLAGYLAQASGVAGYRGRIGNRVMLIGQAPGHLSVERGEPFSGPGGKTLDRWLTMAGYEPGALRSEAYLSAMTKCDPGRNPRGDGDRKPSAPELALCSPFLLRELELVRPAAILLVGGMAITAFLGTQKLDDVVGRAYLSTPEGPVEIAPSDEEAESSIASHTTNADVAYARLLPLPHPSGVSRWMNDPAHQALVAQAMGWLGRWRRDDFQ